jgi:tetratricopeptide (TPR) repeat protein
MITVLEILERARTAGQRLPYNEAAVLFAAAVRLAAANDSTVRARLLQIDDTGGLRLEPFDEEASEADPAYLAPELLSPEAPDKNDPKVQVYAAGVLGYELLTGKHAPPSGHSTDLSGPLGEVLRLALAADRRTRIEDLKQLEEAVEGVQPRPPAEGERNILLSLRNRSSRPPPEKEAVAKLIDRLQQLETQVATLGRVQSRMEAAQRQSLETMERFEVGQLRAGDAGRRRQPVIAPAILAGTLSAVAVVAVAWGLGLFASPSPVRPAPPPVTSEPPVPPEAKEEAKPAPAETKPAERKPAPVEPKPAAADGTPSPNEAKPAQSEPATPGQANSAAGAPAESNSAQTDAAAPVEVKSAQTNAAEDAGAAAETGGSPAAPAAAPAPKKRAAPSSQAAMLHALALSQVRRGEAALEQGNADDALASFRAALENEPTIAVAFRGLGMAYAMQGHDAEALQAYDKYLRLSPKAADAPEIRKSIRELRTRAKGGATQD